MNLVKFLYIGAVFLSVLGEFGRIPFGASSTVRISDIVLGFGLVAFLVWHIGIKSSVSLPFGFVILICFWMVAGLSLFASGNLSGGLYLVRFIIYSSSFLLCFFLIQEKYFTIESLFVTLLTSSTFFLALGFFQLLILPDMQVFTDLGYDPHIGRLVSSFLDPNFAGVYLNISLLVCLYLLIRCRTRVLWFLSLLFVFGLVLTFSRSAYLMLTIQLLFFGFLKSWRLVFLILVLLTLSYLFIPRLHDRVAGGVMVDASAGERFVSWRLGFFVFRGHPVLGVGFNNLREILQGQNFVGVNTLDGGHSGAGVDSSLIFVLATTGLIGLVVDIFWWGWLIALSSWFLRCGRDLTSALILLCLATSLLVNSQFINSLFYPPVMLLFYSVAGAIYAVLHRGRPFPRANT